ncbi:hypothetical protein AVEN_31357-1 [Araneus ventricosus]|uniref:Uncharacterized protein n=1 Tax=Araneus ventricosus TaxID=182803 RepID=A0A4Y2F736_ARAVE|nr:hypothetical protein AVEN_31357-1 [Araneus ventricosus]
MGSLKPTDTDTISEYARFLILTVPNGELGNMSPFAVEKALKGIGGSPKSVKKLKSGDLLIETTSAIQTKSFLIPKSILKKPLSVTIHRTLNSCRGVISEPQLLKDRIRNFNRLIFSRSNCRSKDTHQKRKRSYTYQTYHSYV